MNPALVDRGREAFVAEITRDLPETPVYFLHSRDLNKSGPRLDSQREMPPLLGPREVAARVRTGAVLLDTRPAQVFGECHLARAMNVSLDGQYASWVGTLLKPDQPILLVAEPARAEEAVMRLARVGYEEVVGILEGGCDAWRAAGLPVDSVPQVKASTLRPGDRAVLDVRRGAEWERFHLPGATHVPLAQLPERLRSLDRGVDWTVVCATGYRSSIAASLLKREGFSGVRNVVDGMDAYYSAGLPVEAGAAS